MEPSIEASIKRLCEQVAYLRQEVAELREIVLHRDVKSEYWDGVRRTGRLSYGEESI